MMILGDLEIYQSSLLISEKLWVLVSQWDYFCKDTVGKQLVRSADSISANIAEGYGRYFYKENKQFYYYSRGSLIETQTWFLKAHQRNLISEEVYKSLNEELDTLHKKPNAYIKYIGKDLTTKPIPNS